MSTPLRDLIGDLLGDPSTRAAFAADPAGFLRGHGWDGLDGPDVRAALTALAEELPIEQASRVVEALGEGERFAEGLDGAIQGLGLAAGLDAGDLLAGEARSDPQLGVDDDAPAPADSDRAPTVDGAAPPADADESLDDPTSTSATAPDRAGLDDATLDPTEGIDSGPDEPVSPGLHDNGHGPHPDPAGGLDLDTAPPDELAVVDVGAGDQYSELDPEPDGPAPGPAAPDGDGPSGGSVPDGVLLDDLGHGLLDASAPESPTVADPLEALDGTVDEDAVFGTDPLAPVTDPAPFDDPDPLADEI